ncbi:MAG TPA: isochorismatase family cysteine hydrolase [Xanthobacteraceae bacterium]|nr:isochorismatase family cysteine hydrolase [Xanthobacteraceae bacterium]
MHPTQFPAHVIDRIVERRGRLHGFESVDSSRTALVVVDMQNVFCAPGAAVEVPLAREIVPNINRLARATRDCGGMVVWVQMTMKSREEWALVLDNLISREKGDRVLAAIKPGSEGHALWPEMEPSPEDIHVAKNRFSAFLPSSSDIAEQLRNRGIDTVIITGTLTNVCCESSGRDAAMMDFKTFMISDANAALTDEAHVTTLTNFIQTFGDVRTTDDMIGLLQAGRAKVARRA